MKAVCKRIIINLLIKEAAVLLRRHQPTVVAITGSVGKTTTKDAVYAAVKNSISARKSEKSFNSEIGVPLTVLGLSNGWNSPLLWIKNIVDGFFIAFFSRQYPAVLILETGIDRPGDMDRLTSWIKPDIVVLTRLPSVPVHVEYFSTPEQVAEEKLKLVTALKPDGTFIYNKDDTIIESHLDEVLQRSLGFSRYLPSEYTGSRDQIIYRDDRPVGYEFTITHAASSNVVRLHGTVGSQQVYACTAAVAVADVLGISLETATADLSELRTPNGRLRVIEGIKSTTILDDTYNSSPTAAEQALETLAGVKYAARKIAVMGDMLELGRFSSAAHEQIGTQAASMCDRLITVGVRSRKIAEGALEAGMPEEHILQYEDSVEAARELQNYIEPGDVILVKGSQGIRAERIVEEIMAHPEAAAELLVRQDDEWQKR